MNRPLALIGVLPLLVLSNALITGLVIAPLALIVPWLCALALKPLRRQLDLQALIVAALMLGAALISAAHLLIATQSAELVAALAPYLPWLLLPCLAQSYAPLSLSKLGQHNALLALLLIICSALRELLATGQLGYNLHWLMSSAPAPWQLSQGLPLLTQAAAGFMLLGIVLALYRHFRQDPAL